MKKALVITGVVAGLGVVANLLYHYFAPDYDDTFDDDFDEDTDDSKDVVEKD